MRTTKIKRRTVVISWEGVYEQGDRLRADKMRALGDALESGLAIAGRAAGIVRLYCIPTRGRIETKPRPRGR